MKIYNTNRSFFWVWLHSATAEQKLAGYRGLLTDRFCKHHNVNSEVFLACGPGTDYEVFWGVILNRF